MSSRQRREGQGGRAPLRGQGAEPLAGVPLLALAEEDALPSHNFDDCVCLEYPKPEFVEEETLEKTRKRCKWDNDDYICRGHILNGMSDALFNVYQNVESTKELWNQLEAKYIEEDTSSKKFLVSNFNNYRMVDSRSVMEQYHELLRILGQYTQHGLFMDESISVSSIIDKLPPSWKDFKHMLKHNKDELSLVQLGSHFRIEKTLRMEESGKGKGKYIIGSSSVNMVEDDKNNKNNKNSKGNKRKFHEKNNDSNKKSKMMCWKCGKPGHFKKDCRVKKNNGVSTSRSGQGMMKLLGGLTREQLVMHVRIVASLVPFIRKNLMSGPVLNKYGYKQVYESDKYILSRHGVFIGFEYYNNGMFMLNHSKVPSSINSVYMAYSHVVGSKLWHARLGHVRYQRLHDMSKDRLIPSFDKNMEKCNNCMLTKITRQPFKDIKRNSALLDMIHSDLCDFHATPSIGNKKYVAVVRLPEPKRKILGEKDIDCIFIGYAEHSKTYRFYVIEPNDFVSVNSVIESRDAIFDENIFSSIPRPKDIVSSSNGTQGGELPGETPTEIPEPQKSNRARVAKSYGSDFQLYLVEGSRDEIASQYSYCYSIKEDPKTFDEAMKSRDVAFWKEAVDDEIGSIMENNTWVLSDYHLVVNL
ncbi:zinc finger, CCHC-type containing protein [Tanacetum coccineum]